MHAKMAAMRQPCPPGALLSGRKLPPSRFSGSVWGTRALLISAAFVGLSACGSDPEETEGSGGAASGGDTSSGARPGSGGLGDSGGANSAGGSTGGSAWSSGGVSGEGGSSNGGVPATGGSPGSGGERGDACAHREPLARAEPFDCGEAGVVFADRGPSQNRVNYVIV